MLKSGNEEQLLKDRWDRIYIIGTSGSGKTTLGKKLSDFLEIELIDLDDLLWLPEWIERDQSDAEKLIQEEIAQKQWIITGNYSKLNEGLWQKATTIIWLDYPFWIVFWRALKRSIIRIIKKESCCNGNKETFFRLLSAKSILLWVIRTYQSRKEKYTYLFSHPPRKNLILIRLKTKKETDHFLANVNY